VQRFFQPFLKRLFGEVTAVLLHSFLERRSVDIDVASSCGH